MHVSTMVIYVQWKALRRDSSIKMDSLRDNWQLFKSCQLQEIVEAWYDPASEIQTVHLKPLSCKDRFRGYLHLQDIASYEAIATWQMWNTAKLYYEKVWRQGFSGVIRARKCTPQPCLIQWNQSRASFFVVFSVVSWTISMSEILQYPGPCWPTAVVCVTCICWWPLASLGPWVPHRRLLILKAKTRGLHSLRGWREVRWIQVLVWSWNPGQPGQTSNKNYGVSDSAKELLVWHWCMSSAR